MVFCGVDGFFDNPPSACIFGVHICDMLSTQSSAAQLVAMDTETVESVDATHLFTRNCSQETVRPDFKK